MKGITLIGMPGAGKSTIGKTLADRLGFQFVDLDVLICEKEGRSHDQISREKGDAELMRLEEKYTLELDFSCFLHSRGRFRIAEVPAKRGVEARCSCTVFSPGGSIVYSPRAMEKLRAETTVVYLELPLLEIENRLGNGAATRGIVGLSEKGLGGLFEERASLYQSFAHQTINCFGLNDKTIVEKIANFYLI